MNKKIFIAMCIFVLMLFSATVNNQAATITVTNLNNSGTGSLRQAIINAVAGDTINFAAGLNGSILLTVNELVINKNLTINGPGANVLTLEMDSGDEQRVLHVTAGNVSISGLTLTGGNIQRFNTTLPGGSALLIETGATVNVNNCWITNNQLFYENFNGQFNGTVQNHGTLTITNSSVSENPTANGTGGIANYGTLTMTNSTVSDNAVFVDSFGVGGIHNVSGATTLLNCTIADNGGAGSYTGGVRREAGSVIIKNTIIANNFHDTGTISANDVQGTLTSQDNNLIGTSTGGTMYMPNDLLGVNPQLAALANNGGTTPTRALLSGSPAIDAGNNTGAPATDQRGAARPQGTAVDIGAYESGVPNWTGQTNIGSNSNATLGTVSVTFSNVSTAGTTSQVPIDPATAGTLPGGYSFGAGYPAYEITTTASYTAPITVCLQVPGVTNAATFAGLRIMHNEGGSLVDRTILPPDAPAPNFATKTICARVNSLSPFVVANAAPTAASVSIGGRVTDANGNGISKARVSITNQNGETRTVLTNPFGYYRFGEIPVGETYLISVANKRHQFTNNAQILTALEETDDINFVASP